MATSPQVVAILRAIEERLTALMDLETDPLGRIQQAQNDALRTYGIVAQLAEVTGIQRDQVLALTDAMSVYLGRLIEHDRRMIAQHDQMLELLHGVATGVGATEIAQHAVAARAVLQAEAEERMAEIELSADEARALLSVARMDARAVVRRAVDKAQDEIAAAAEAARAALEKEDTA